MSCIITLELLPNEILLQCLKYFTALELFDLFDDLNIRFNKIIRSISLHLDLKNVSKSKFEQFCTKTRKEPRIKEQIYSIHLSDARPSYSANLFLFNYSLEEFSSLQSLYLIDMRYENGHKFMSMLPMVPDLRCFHVSQYDGFNMSEDISLAKFERLTIPYLPDKNPTPSQPWLMKSLTLSSTSLEKMLKIFEYAPRLTNFTLDYLEWNSKRMIISSHPMNSAMSKIRLNKGDSKVNFQLMDIILKCTPNLKVLSLIVNGGKQLIDADQWQYLIMSSLTHLAIFEFQFSFSRTRNDDIHDILLQCQQFQGDFWQKQHQWNVRYEISTSSIKIHTIPYRLNTYALSSLIEDYHPESINPKAVFDNVTNLKVPYQMIQTLFPYYFSNVKILNLEEHTMLNRSPQQLIFDMKHIQSLKQFICFSHITDLNFHYNYTMKSSSVMVKLLNEAPNLSSIAMDSQLFRFLCSDEQLCSMWKRMIKKFDLYGSDDALCDDSNEDGSSLNEYNGYLFNASYSIEQFCRNFPYLEQLQCQIVHPIDLVNLFQGLSNLSYMCAGIPLLMFGYFDHQMWVEKFVPLLKNDFHLKEDDINFHYQSIRTVVTIHRTIE